MVGLVEFDSREEVFGFVDKTCVSAMFLDLPK